MKTKVTHPFFFWFCLLGVIGFASVAIQEWIFVAALFLP